MSASASPKRRHILSSINPDPDPDPYRGRLPRRRKQRSPRRSASPAREHASPAPAPGDKAGDDGEGHNDNTTEPRPTRLKLKGHRKERSRDGDGHRERDRHRHGHDSHSRRHRHGSRRHRSPTPPNPHDPPPLDADTAFRESLFDAMADDEGAAYWEGVYGQPVHVYAAERVGVGASGALERMTEDEYAAYVREKMWEKTHAGLLEEKARREERRRRDRERREQRREEQHEQQRRDRRLREDVERSLRRGQERRRRRVWGERWERYARAWAAWDGSPEGLAWPVSGDGDDGGNGETPSATGGGRGGAEDRKRQEIREDDVRQFFLRGMDLEAIGEKEFAARLKEERVRWHPDKIQQRLGGRRADAEPLLRDVTAVFQIIDKLWGEMRRP